MTERCRNSKAKAMAFFQRWTLIIWQATIEPEIREITSIVMPSPTDTDRSAEDRIRRIEEHNLAAHHAPLFKTHNGLWPSAMPVNPVECSNLDVKKRDYIDYPLKLELYHKEENVRFYRRGMSRYMCNNVLDYLLGFIMFPNHWQKIKKDDIRASWTWNQIISATLR